MKPGGNINIARAAVIVIVVTAVLSGFIILTLMFPLEKYAGLYPSCPLHRFTGFYCPGCGSTRMFFCLLHGDFSGAFHKNPLAFMLLPFLAYGLLAEICRWIGFRLPGYFLRGWMIYSLLAIILLYGILRNIPFYPFILLCPR